MSMGSWPHHPADERRSGPKRHDPPISGFRLLSVSPHAALVTEIGPWLDPTDGTDARVPDGIPKEQAAALTLLQRFGREVRVDGPYSMARHLSPAPTPRAHVAAELAFFLAADQKQPERRWPAIVSRAYAAADCVAYAHHGRKEAVRHLREGAKRIAYMLGDGAWAELFMNARQRFYYERPEFDDSGLQIITEDPLPGMLGYLRDRAEQARTLARAIEPVGRPPETARSHFVLQLAWAYLLLTGDTPVFSGGISGNDRGGGPLRKRAAAVADDRHAAATVTRRTPGWHALVNAAVDIVNLRDKASDDTVLRSARRAGNFLGHFNWNVQAARLRFDYGLAYQIIPPHRHIENVIGVDLYVTSREGAYCHPKTAFFGPTHVGSGSDQ